MKYTKFTLMIFGTLLSCFTLVEAAKAEGSRSYIAPGGGDNRPCSRNQPCRTFDGALAKTDAGGEIIALETGTYDATTITKSITLTAAPTADVVIRATSGNAVTIDIASEDSVVLRGLKLSGPGMSSNVTGVSIVSGSGGAVFIENSLISNFGTGVHAMISNSSLRLGINDCVVRNNNTGVMAQFGGAEQNGVFATRTRFEGNSIGVKTSGVTGFVVRECVAAGNGIGFLADPSGGLVVSHSLITRNGVGIEVRAVAKLVLASSIISGNVKGVTSDAVVRSTGNNVFAENHVDKSGAFETLTGIH